MSILLLVILLVLVFGGGGAFYGSRAGWGPSLYGGGLVGVVAVILLVLWATGNFGAGVIR